MLAREPRESPAASVWKHTSARRCDHDQRRDKKFDGHDMPLVPTLTRQVCVRASLCNWRMGGAVPKLGHSAKAGSRLGRENAL